MSSLDARPLDAHAKPPSKLREIYKHFQKLKFTNADHHPADLLDTLNLQPPSGSASLLERHLQLPADLRRIFSDFLQCSEDVVSLPDLRPVYEVEDMPGLLIYPALLPPEVQLNLLEKSLHRDVANPVHQTNVHLFHEVMYPPLDGNGRPVSFFDHTASGIIFRPKDANVHKSFTTRQLMDRKLRWATLGGQYDWTNKAYPEQPPPDFPSDTKKLLEGLFPMKAEAAILNLYSPGDTLSLHRDVSEQCNQPLVSISIGCDAVLIVGLDSVGDDQVKFCSIRLRSGDAVLMKAESRYAWHGVPKVIEDTCPQWLENWPASDDSSQYEQWRGWMKTKRVNLNVRQMFEGEENT